MNTPVLEPLGESDPQLRVVRLLLENDQLRHQLALATRQQLREIGMLAHAFAREHQRWPAKPSELAKSTGGRWQLFIAPYDASDHLFCSLQRRADVWDWIDAHSSYVFFGGADNCSADEAAIQERRAFIPGMRWQHFKDGHTALEPPRKVI